MDRLLTCMWRWHIYYYRYNYLSDFRLHLETTAPKITNSQGSYFDHDLNDHDSNHSSEMRGLCLMKLFGKSFQINLYLCNMKAEIVFPPCLISFLLVCLLLIKYSSRQSHDSSSINLLLFLKCWIVNVVKWKLRMWT